MKEIIDATIEFLKMQVQVNNPVIGLIIGMLIIMLIDYNFLVRASPVLYVVSIILLVLTLCFLTACSSQKSAVKPAREKLIERINTYKLFKKQEVIIVFDAYKVKGNRGEVERHDGVTVVYTKEAQTADSYIEKTARELSRNYKVTVATSDGLEQLIIFGSGAYRMPSRILKQDVEMVEESISQMLESYNISAEKADFYKIFKDRFKDIQ